MPLPKSRVPVCATQNLQLELLEKRIETQNVITFCFRVECDDGGVFRYHPGQALAMRVPMPGGEQVRSFTIASAPNTSPARSYTGSTSDVADYIEITVKAASNAHTTRWMHEQWQPGIRVPARGPFGEFSLVHYPQRPLLLIGAGSGMTPMMSMLRWLHRRKENSDVVVIQQASRPSDLLFGEALRQIDADMEQLRYFACVSDVPVGQAWSGVRGKPKRSSLRTLVPDIAQRTVLCCGPDGFTALIRTIYVAEGGEADGFLTETFGSTSGIVAMPVQENAPQVRSEAVCRIEIDKHQFFATPTQTLVDAAADNGIRIPTACQEGICGTCKLKLLQGDVKMAHQGGLSSREEQVGYVLACSCRAVSDLVLTRKDL